MPRTARRKSPTDIYHVILRGINRQIIFENDRDRGKFLRILRECKEISDCRIFAYCLMSNHVHLLVKAEGEPLETFVKRVGCRYVFWFNKRYERVGHLFQDRYKSIPVEDERSFLAVLRYIVQNPQKAGLESKTGSYLWSSFHDYFDDRDTLTDTVVPLSLIGSKEEMLHFLQEEETEIFPEIEEADKPTREEIAKRKLFQTTGCCSTSDFQRLSFSDQEKYIRMLYERHLSMGQIAMLTGKSKATVFRIIKKG